jgi:hypothetical protein
VIRHRGTESGVLTAEDFFLGHEAGLAVYRAVEQAALAMGGVSVRVTKSQIAFRRRRAFAYVWRPGQYVRNPVPAVLSIALPHRSASTRFKSVVHPSPRVWMHHLELTSAADVDDEVRDWLLDAHGHAA